MHDPLVVAFEIRRPWPRRQKMRKPSGRRWQIRLHHEHGDWCDDACKQRGNPFPWWKLRSYSAFWTLAGREFYWPAMFTVWHVEPGGHDSGEICKHWVRYQDESGKWHADARRAWKWHVWHWRIQWHFAQVVKRFLFERCIECGHRFPWGYDPVSHQWNGDNARWFRINKVAYHHECSSVVGARVERETYKKLIRHLFNAYAVLRDKDEIEALDDLTNVNSRGLEFAETYKLQGILGYERDDDYKLVKKSTNA